VLKPENFIMMPIPSDRYTDVCALLGGAAVATLAATGAGKPSPEKPTPADTDAGPSVAGEQSSGASAGAEASQAAAGDAGGADTGEIDAHGHPWSADLHASTKGKTKDGLWRMKVGVTRPAPLPGFPVDNSATSGATGTEPGTQAPSATSQAATDQGSGQPATSGAEEEDEFAAFRTAAAASETTDAAAAAAVPARQYSDADLGALCNQAAVKLGDPGPVKAIIAKYTPEGSVAHSRNIPTEQRAAFVGEVETAAGIQFAG
jgi:hypothetical protein